jgi:hypothetical protein
MMFLWPSISLILHILFYKNSHVMIVVPGESDRVCSHCAKAPGLSQIVTPCLVLVTPPSMQSMSADSITPQGS